MNKWKPVESALDFEPDWTRYEEWFMIRYGINPHQFVVKDKITMGNKAVRFDTEMNIFSRDLDYGHYANKIDFAAIVKAL